MALFDFLSLKNDVNVPSKSNKQKKLCEFFAGILKVNEKSTIRIHPKMSWIRNTGVNHTPLPGVLDTNLQGKYLEAVERAPEQEVAWEDSVSEAGQRVTLQVRQQRRVHRLHPIIKLDQ